MEGRKWEDLSTDCLANVFGRVEMESLLLDVPFVCKPWFKATLSPLCWKELDLSDISLCPWIYGGMYSRRLVNEFQLKDNLSITAYMKYVVKRSRGSATFLSLPGCCSEQALLYVADECPDLRTLLLPYNLPRHSDHMLPNLMSNWKSLEILRLGSTLYFQEVLSQISIHSKNFVGLSIICAKIGQEEASALVTLLPKIKQFFVRHASMGKENLVKILQGCKELDYFDVSNCIGFNEGDDQILKFASHIHTFKHEGSKLFDDYDDVDDYYMDNMYFDYRDVILQLF